MHAIQLIDFLTHGSLGPLRFNMSFEDVKALCGEPESVSEWYQRKTVIYGSVRLEFHRDYKVPPLNYMEINFRTDASDVPRIFECMDWWPQFGTTLAEFEAFAKVASIRLKDYMPLTFEDQFSQITDGNAVVIFKRNDKARMIIDSIQLANCLR